MKISDCTGARVHSALTKDKNGNNRITWCVHYKNESIWCNTEEYLMLVLRKITMVQLFGENYKSWKIGVDGWRKNIDNCTQKNILEDFSKKK